jgi:FkbM family methyltransferase
MKIKVKALYKFTVKFGKWDGFLLWLKFYAQKYNDLRVPNLKHSLFLRANTSDIPAFLDVFLKDEYKIKFTNKPSIVIDGGANIGLFTIKIKNEFPDAKIISIEPDPDNFKLLQKNVSKYDNIFLENSGIWFKDTKLKVYDKFDSGKWGMVVEEDLVDGSISAISMKSLMDKYSLDYIDVLKLDIETSEKQLFSENYEDWLPKVKTIIIELHDWMEKGTSKPFFTAINKSFKNYSYSHCGENVIIVNEDLA